MIGKICSRSQLAPCSGILIELVFSVLPATRLTLLQGRQIQRLVNELPAIKETLRKVLLAEFRLDLPKLAKSGHKYYFPVLWSSPFLAMHRSPYQTPTQGQFYLDPPRSLLHKRLNKQDRVRRKNADHSSLVRCIEVRSFALVLAYHEFLVCRISLLKTNRSCSRSSCATSCRYKTRT